MKIKNEFELGELVYIETDTDQIAHQIVSILVTPLGLRYECLLYDSTSWHYEIELSREPDLGLKEE